MIFARISPSMENGKVAIVPALKTEVALISGELLVLRPQPGVDARMVWAFLRQERLLRRLRGFMTGSSGYQRLDREILERVELPALEKERWHAASAALEKLDLALAARRETTDVLRRLPGAAAAKLAESAPRAPLGKRAQFRSGTSERLADVGSQPVLRSPNLLDGSIDQSDLRFLPEARADRELPRLQSGDLLMIRTSGSATNFARAAIYERQPADASFASYLVRIRSERFDPDFLWSWLQTSEAKSACFEQAASTTSRFNLTVGALERLPIPQLTSDRQDRLAGIGREIRKMLVIANLQLDLIRRAIQAHLARQFAGANLPDGSEAAPPRPAVVIPPGFMSLFEAASATQRVTWEAILRGEGLSLDDLASERERAELQHTLTILEQIGIVVREHEGVIESWRLPDAETELVA